ncbi:MAG: DMT family transporter [Bacillota bacterium]
MSSKIFALLMALIAGCSMAIQGSLNSVLGRVIGLLEATLVVHVIGSALVFVLLFIFQLGQGSLTKLWTAPWYSYLGGIISVLIIYGVVASIPRVGVAIATTAIIVGQVSTALLIDHFGLFGLDKIPFTWLKLVGLGLLAAGAKIILN